MSRDLIKSTSKVGGFTLVSRVLGLVRDIVFAGMFAPGAGLDAFLVAFKIPNFLRRLFAEGAFSQAFVPVLAEYKEKHEAQEKVFIDRVAGTLAGILLVVTLLGVVGAPVVITIFAPGFITDGPKFDLTVQMLRITFPYLFFISLTAFAGGILNTYGRFGVPAFTPVLLNLALIGAALLVVPLVPKDAAVTVLAWGVFVGGLAQLLFQLPFLRQLRRLPRPRWGGQDPGVKKMLALMLPAIFGSSVAQINLLFDTLIASFLVTGSVSWLYFSDRLLEFPLGVFGIALATVILPNLSRQHAQSNPDQFKRTMDWALRLVLLIGFPAAVGLFILAGPILTTLFQWNEFSAHDVQMSSLSLMAYTLGLPAFILVKVLAPGFFARQDTRTPVRVGVIAMISNMGLNVLFVVPMVVGGFAAPHVGLALATSLAAYINAGLLYTTLRRTQVYQAQPGWAKLWVQVTISVICMALIVAWGSGPTQSWIDAAVTERVTHLIFWVVMAMVVYFASLWLTGVRFKSLWRKA